MYLDKCLTKEEFKEKAMSMDREIERQEEALGAFSRYKFEKNEVKTVVNKCLKYAENYIKSSEISDEFIKAIEKCGIEVIDIMLGSIADYALFKNEFLDENNGIIINATAQTRYGADNHFLFIDSCGLLVL